MAEGFGSNFPVPLRPLLVYLMLGEEAYVSAAQLAESLGMGQRSIYRHIERLRAAGLEVEGSTRLGYRLGARPQLGPLFLSRTERAALVAASSGALKAKLRAL